VKNILEEIRSKEDTFGPMGVGNEKTRFFFVGLILSKALRVADPDKILLVSIEHRIKGKEAWGPIEYVITGNVYKKLLIVDIIEVKQENFDQGRAQLYMQLYTAFKTNLSFDKEALNFPLYGAITNCLEWIFVKYDGDCFKETTTLLVKNSADENGFKDLFDRIVVMLETQVKASNPFVKKMAEMEKQRH